MPSPRDVPVRSNATRCKGPDFEGQIRRLRSGDGVHFTTAGALKLAHYGRLQDDQPAARRGAYRGSLRGDHVRGQTGPRSREGPETSPGLGQQLKPIALDLALIRRSVEQLAADL
jgi:uncharacterized protein